MSVFTISHIKSHNNNSLHKHIKYSLYDKQQKMGHAFTWPIKKHTFLKNYDASLNGDDL